MIRINDVEKAYHTPPGQKAKERIQALRGDTALEVSYMTLAQKMQDERRVGYKEGLQDTVLALKGLADPSVIAERLKLPLKKIMEILEEA